VQQLRVAAGGGDDVRSEGFGVLGGEGADPTGPFGNKSLGEPPIISQPPAIRNALLHATGVAINKLPLNPQRLFEAFSESGLLKEVI